MEIDPADRDSFVIRFYMTVSRRAHPDLALCLDGFSSRERNRRIQAMLQVAAHAERHKVSASEERGLPRTPTVNDIGEDHVKGGLGVELNDIEKAFAEFGEFRGPGANP